MKKITVVVFGASVIEGVIGLKNPALRWTLILKKKLSEAFPNIQFDVINSGVGGETMREGMSRFEKDVKAYSPDYVILGFGGNHDDPEHEERRVSAEEYWKLLNEFKNKLPHETRMSVMTLPPAIDEQHWFSTRNIQYALRKGGTDKMLERDREISRKFAMENNYPVIDLSLKLRDLMKTKPKNYYTLPDGIHLAEEGYVILTDMAFDILFKSISSLMR